MRARATAAFCRSCDAAVCVSCGAEGAEAEAEAVEAGEREGEAEAAEVGFEACGEDGERVCSASARFATVSAAKSYQKPNVTSK